jgi:nicotinamidase-related amidase
VPTTHTHHTARDNVAAAEALVLIDLQEDFFDDPELKRCREDVSDACNLLIGRARSAGAPVIIVRTVHAADRSTWALNMLDDDQGMALEGDPGAETIAELETDGTIEVTKTRDSAFFGTDLEDVLHEHGATVLAMAGVSTESCIATTASEAYARDFRVLLIDRATASVDEDMHCHVLERLSWQYRQPVVEPSEVSFTAPTRA